MKSRGLGDVYKRQGAIDPGVIDESAQLAGFSNTSALRLGDWQGNCLVQRSS